MIQCCYLKLIKVICFLLISFMWQVCRKCGLLGYENHKTKAKVCSTCKNGDNISSMKLPYACKLLFQVNIFYTIFLFWVLWVFIMFIFYFCKIKKFINTIVDGFHPSWMEGVQLHSLFFINANQTHVIF